MLHLLLVSTWLFCVSSHIDIRQYVCVCVFNSYFNSSICVIYSQKICEHIPTYLFLLTIYCDDINLIAYINSKSNLSIVNFLCLLSFMQKKSEKISTENFKFKRFEWMSRSCICLCVCVSVSLSLCVCVACVSKFQ